MDNTYESFINLFFSQLFDELYKLAASFRIVITIRPRTTTTTNDVAKDRKAQFKIVKEWLSKADTIVVATDSDIQSTWLIIEAL